MKEYYKQIAFYSVGLLSAAILTLVAYILTQIHVNSYHEVIPHAVLIPSVLILAFLQMCVQLVFFLHITNKSSRWNVVFFLMTFGGVLVIIIASVWIMYHLNYNMTPVQINQYIQDQSGL
ncbi:MAG TPA: cytochrome C oxidase subunit IV family protein [Candidatus Saccharimonadales bacterium]|nr:cytochrome C oxidase subunit IV family protein [Candidatus Saccharimonadales bacterium]